jgi:LysR family transcriptional regulator, mexEF-oprN operon transcriptional activator
MTENYGRDLDLNLIRVFVVVADAGSVTKAAARLYLTQPAISAALRRLTTAVGAPLFVRHGRGLVLSSQGERLLTTARPHLQALVDATLATPPFDPSTSDRILRIGFSDAAQMWLLPALLRTLATSAPRMRIIEVPIQFRTVEAALTERRVDVAVTVADALPASIMRAPLFTGGFLCLFDPRHAKGIGKSITERDYFARDHVIVSYNADLRGLIEDVVRKQRRVRCSLASFAHIGDVLDGSPLLATVPTSVAAHVRAIRPHLRTATLPFKVRNSAGVEMLWPTATHDDPACRFAREQIERIARRA